MLPLVLVVLLVGWLRNVATKEIAIDGYPLVIRRAGIAS
jgi:hypothetical protein